MSTTLEPVLHALGYNGQEKQAGMVKLLHASGAFGELPGVDGVLDDKLAQALLKNITFPNEEQAVRWLHDVTQAHMLRRPPGAERYECEEPASFLRHREALLQALDQAGALAEVKPSQRHYDHVLLLGAVEPMVDQRLDTLNRLWEEGARFDKIYLLGSDRKLVPSIEPSARQQGTEMDMMRARLARKSASWPKELRDVPLEEVNSHGKNRKRANTRDTAQSWLDTHPLPGSVLVISSQPFVDYQDAAIKAALPRAFAVETVGDAAHREPMKISVAMDALARRIDVGLDRLLEGLKTRGPGLGPQLYMLDPASIKTDAATYQFRSGGDASGVTEDRRYNATRWDAVLHGDPLLAHERLDGSLYVADGHHRLDLAKRLNAAGTGPGKVAALVLREADGYTAADAKIIAAYKNIARGQSDPLDAARVFKEAFSGKVNLDLLPPLQMDKGNLTLSFHLSRLSDKALEPVVAGEVPLEMAAEVAKRVSNPERQESVMRIIGRKLRQDYVITRPEYDIHVEVLPAQHIRRSGKAISLEDYHVEKKSESTIPRSFVEALLKERAQAARSARLH